MKYLISLILCLWIPVASAASDTPSIAQLGIDCNTLAEWSTEVDGYQLNLHHVFCGEPGKRGRAKGFHSMPEGIAPSNYDGSESGDPVNSAGVYTLEKIELSFAEGKYTKSFSSMFPNHCSYDQVINSIVYSVQNNSGSCASPDWATCGPNAPKQGAEAYCVATDGSTFTIATAILRSDNKKINTGFPIYRP